MKTLKVNLSFLILSLLATAHILMGQDKKTTDSNSTVPTSSIIMVKFHSDTCTTCKDWSLENPGYNELAAKAKELGVAVTVLDMTNDKTKKTAQATANKLGIAEIYNKNLTTTGIVLLIDTKKNNSVVATINPKEMKYKKQIKIIEKAVKG